MRTIVGKTPIGLFMVFGIPVQISIGFYSSLKAREFLCVG
jgi:hypothetical protein